MHPAWRALATLLALLWLLLPAAVDASPLRVEIQARVAEDLRSISGRMRVMGDEPFRLADPQAAIPPPPDDRTALRTWPLAPEEGAVSWKAAQDGWLEFHAELPRRYGGCGFVPGQGLFMAGGWHPQPLVRGALPAAHWQVRLQLPAGSAGALGDQIGQGELRWQGQGERAALAVLPRSSLTRIETDRGPLMLLARRRPSKARQRWLRRTVEQAWPEGRTLDLVVVDSPLMRRLVRPTPGLLFMSSRAFRLSPGLRHLHQQAVARGLLEAGLSPDLPQLDERSLAAAALSADSLASSPTAQGLLRWFSWLPQVDELLYSGTAPYVAEVLGEAYPGDTLADDLAQALHPQLPGAALAGRIDDLAGQGAALRVAQALLGGQALDAALLAEGIDPLLVRSWMAPQRPQDYSLEVRPQPVGSRIVVKRQAGTDAPREPLVVQADQTRLLWLSEPGEAEHRWDLGEDPIRVTLDPEGHLQQEDRSNDRWPVRWTAVLSAFPTVWNLSAGRIEGYLGLRLRRQHDTRRTNDFYLYTDQVNLAGAQGRIGRAWGPLQDRRWRPHRAYAWISAALLDPDFRPTEQGKLALDAGASLLRDTQTDWLFPLRGHVLGLHGNTGFVPLGGQSWAGLGASAAGVTSAHPRMALAGRLRAGRSWGEVEHRLEVLGGVDDLRSLPGDLAVGSGKVVAMGELRLAPLRHRSLPVGLGWLDELQLAGGVEGGLLTGARVEEGYGDARADGLLAAAGWTASSFVAVDVLGAQPALAGLLVAAPFRGEPEWVGALRPNVYLLWEQAF